MGGQNGKNRSGSENAIDERSFYSMNVVPSKAVFTPALEDVTG